MRNFIFLLLAILLLATPTRAQPKLKTQVNFVAWETDGANPYGGLTLGNDGNFYGTTADGNNNVGTVFQLAPDGTLITLAAFNYTNGANPLAGLALGKDGYFYGTTYGGPDVSSGQGSVFRVSTNGVLTMLAVFNGTNGANPSAELTLGVDDCFYGTTASGGFNGCGTIFRIATNGMITTIASFDGTNGGFPIAALVLGRDGSFYGTASQGGSFGDGTIFQVTTNGILTMLTSFNNTNGAYPAAALVPGNDGSFYGTTEFGGYNTNEFSGGFGTVFHVTTNGALTTLANFNGTNGAYPQAALTLANDGSFYGTTFGGGFNNGSIFRVNTNGGLTSLVNFDGTNGNWPMSSLTIGKDGNFYGTTEEGGIQYNGENVGVGTIFKLIVPPNIDSLSLSNGIPQLLISGLARPSVQIQTTTNLSASWSTLTNISFLNGNNQFNDNIDTTNSPIRYYRAAVE